MNIKYELVFGIEFDKEGNELINRIVSIKRYMAVLDSIVKGFGGYSEDDQLGGYLYSTGQSIHHERSRTLSIIGTQGQRETVMKICMELKEIYNQESIMLIETKVNSVFI